MSANHFKVGFAPTTEPLDKRNRTDNIQNQNLSVENLRKDKGARRYQMLRSKILQSIILFNILFFVGLLVISWFVKLTPPIMIVFALITGTVFGLGYINDHKEDKQ